MSYWVPDDITVHKENIRTHSARRFQERFGQELTPKLRSAYHRQIETGHNAWLVSLQNDRRTKSGCEIYFLVDRSVSKEPIVVVFRRDWMEIVTFLTPDYYKNQITGALARQRQKVERARRLQEELGAPDLRETLSSQDEQAS